MARLRITEESGTRRKGTGSNYSSPARFIFGRRREAGGPRIDLGSNGPGVTIIESENLCIIQKHAHLKCTCDLDKTATDDWKERLYHSDIDPVTINHIIELENEAIHALEVNVDQSIEALLDTYEMKGYLSLDDLNKGISKHYDMVSNELEQPLRLYYRGLVNSSRDDAYRHIGFEREARKKLVRKTAAVGDTDEAYENAVERAFSKVKTVGKDVIEELKNKWIEQGGPSDIVKSFLLEEEEELRDKALSREELAERLRQLWIEKRYNLQRIIRTETVNTSATIQLQEWYDQGIREVERWEIDDLRTCTLCRTLARPGNNVWLIERLLQQQYPVTFCTHPQCRGSYRPRTNWSVFDTFEQKLEEFKNSQDIEAGGSKAEMVPLEYQEQVESVLEDFGPDYGIKFVPEITESKEWQKDRLDYWLNYYKEREAQARMELEKTENRGELVQYTTTNGVVLISGDAGDINRIAVPMLREKARQIYLTMGIVDKSWIENRFNKRKNESEMTLEKEGVEIIGGTPFITDLAGNSPEDYFSECYTNYIADPTRLLYMDNDMYQFLREKYMNREYLVQGGLK